MFTTSGHAENSKTNTSHQLTIGSFKSNVHFVRMGANLIPFPMAGPRIQSPEPMYFMISAKEETLKTIWENEFKIGDEAFLLDFMIEKMPWY